MIRVNYFQFLLYDHMVPMNCFRLCAMVVSGGPNEPLCVKAVCKLPKSKPTPTYKKNHKIGDYCILKKKRVSFKKSQTSFWETKKRHSLHFLILQKLPRKTKPLISVLFNFNKTTFQKRSRVAHKKKLRINRLTQPLTLFFLKFENRTMRKRIDIANSQSCTRVIKLNKHKKRR